MAVSLGKKVALVVACALVACLGLAACGGGGASASYKDGTYTGKSSVMDAKVDGDGYCEVTLKIENGQIADAELKAYEPDGTLKDKDYGKDGDKYAVAQKALAAGDEYVSVLLQSGSLENVDVISGATYLHDQFAEAVRDALDKAKA